MPLNSDKEDLKTPGRRLCLVFSRSGANHAIAHTHMGLDIAGMRRIGLDFLAQRAHEYAQRRKVRLVLDAPNLIQDKAVRKDPVHIVGQQAQELILDGRQM